ncbi:MAG TPA: hypothetical protein VGM62_13125, partial [Chthoniobacterales bacterium]
MLFGEHLGSYMLQQYWRYGLVFGIAGLVGVLLDRAVVGHGNVEERVEVSAPRQSISAPVESVHSVTKETVNAPAAEVSGPANAKTSPKSLAAILAERDPRQRTSDLETFINSLAPGDYGDALKRLRRIPSTNERDLASRLLVARW